jgi:Na+/H+-dicarboxylate symporter
MFTFSIVTVVIFALVLGVALGLLANAGDRQNLKDAQNR